ncbi:MAG: hypothetical protein ABIT07_04385 [Ferruginibacter sp.]
MKAKIFINIRFALFYVILIPHYIILLFSKNKEVVHYDVDRWLKIMRLPYSRFRGLTYLLMNHSEFRNLFYHRLGGIAYYVLNIYLRKLPTLYITTSKIGKGLFIHHGFATIISADSIGDDCWINQQVTIGFSNDTDCPVILNNVRVAAGAKVFGKIVCGNNSIIGANAVVTKDVPDNCTVVGVPAKIIKRNGFRKDEKL